MTALIPEKHGTIHRTACSFHDMMSELSNLSWRVIVHQASPVSIMQCRRSYQICVNFMFFRPWCYSCVSRLACDQCAISVMHVWTLNLTHLVHETVFASWTLDIDGRLRRRDSSHKNAEYISIYVYIWLCFSDTGLSMSEKDKYEEVRIWINRLCNTMVIRGMYNKLSARVTHIYCKESVQICHAAND